MAGRKVIVYYAWSRPGEVGAPLEVIENRFPTLFESRRMLYPRFEALSDPGSFDQSVAGFLDHIMKANFAAFVEQAGVQTGRKVAEIERVAADGRFSELGASLLDGADTLIIISFDSLRTAQSASAAEVEAVRAFLAQPDHLLFVCPHHDIGDAPDAAHNDRLRRQTADFLHHGDRTIPLQQRFGGFARSLLAGLGAPVGGRCPAAQALSVRSTAVPDRIHSRSCCPNTPGHASLRTNPGQESAKSKTCFFGKIPATGLRIRSAPTKEHQS
jgi:hypothetical protein